MMCLHLKMRFAHFHWNFVVWRGGVYGLVKKSTSTFFLKKYKLFLKIMVIPEAQVEASASKNQLHTCHLLVWGYEVMKRIKENDALVFYFGWIYQLQAYTRRPAIVLPSTKWMAVKMKKNWPWDYNFCFKSKPWDF